MENPDILYNTIGLGYNSTRQADPFLAGRLYELLMPKAGGLFLDIGCGTGNYTIALADKCLEFYGLDPSEKMLDIASSKNSKINWLLGHAENIPADSDLFDGVIATLTIHHWKNFEKSLIEINRVLMENGNIVFFTSTPEQMNGYWLNHYFPKMLEDSIVQMPSFKTIKTALDNSGFQITGTEKYFIEDDLKDCFLYAGKNRPELYFDFEIRKGISSFSALANIEEVKQGLVSLTEDLKSGKFKEVQSEYNNDNGDYLFIIAEKKNN